MKDKLDCLRFIKDTEDTRFLIEVFETLINNPFLSKKEVAKYASTTDFIEDLIDHCDSFYTLNLVFECLLEHRKFEADEKVDEFLESLSDGARESLYNDLLEYVPILDLVEALAKAVALSPTDKYQAECELKEKGLIK